MVSFLGGASGLTYPMNTSYLCPQLSCQRDFLWGRISPRQARPNCLGRPVGRDLCLAKGPSNSRALRDASCTSEAPSGLMRWDERWLGRGVPTRCAQTRPANLFERSPHWTRRQASDHRQRTGQCPTWKRQEMLCMQTGNAVWVGPILRMIQHNLFSSFTRFDIIIFVDRWYRMGFQYFKESRQNKSCSVNSWNLEFHFFKMTYKNYC